MKEQVGVDEIKHLQLAIEDNLCNQCVITFDEICTELKRLKRLDENIKSEIIKIKEKYPVGFVVDYDASVDYLESLDK